MDSGNTYRSQCQPLTSQPLTLQVTSLLERHIIFLDVSKIDFNLHFLGCSRKASIPLNNLSHLKLPVSAQFFQEIWSAERMYIHLAPTQATMSKFVTQTKVIVICSVVFQTPHHSLLHKRENHRTLSPLR